MRATKEQWNEIKKAVKANFGKDFQCKKMYGDFEIYGRDGMTILEAEKLDVVLKSLGYNWIELQRIKGNSAHANTRAIHADFKIVA
tara:strand:- start:489 stop:746 length:258 start_codon:yes stop_codon:yes gene_type:complete